jgi:hypothetical protein
LYSSVTPLERRAFSQSQTVTLIDIHPMLSYQQDRIKYLPPSLGFQLRDDGPKQIGQSRSNSDRIHSKVLDELYTNRPTSVQLVSRASVVETRA